jgi:nitrite reductase/ring-hydroxylating ferredoxin subunit
LAIKRHAVCAVDDLPPGERRIVSVGRRSIGVFNVDGEYHALANRCPHAGGPLCLGPVTGTTTATGPHEGVAWIEHGRVLRCPWHAWEFDIATGRTLTEPVLAVQTYRVVVEDGQIWVEA